MRIDAVMFCNENDRPYTLRADLVAAAGDGSGGNRVPSRWDPFRRSTTSGMPSARSRLASRPRPGSSARSRPARGSPTWAIGHQMPLRSSADGGIWMPNSWPLHECHPGVRLDDGGGDHQSRWQCRSLCRACRTPSSSLGPMAVPNECLDRRRGACCCPGPAAGAPQYRGATRQHRGVPQVCRRLHRRQFAQG